MSGVGDTRTGGFTAGKAAIVGAAIWLPSFVALALLTEGSLRAGLLVGAATGALAGAVGLVLLQSSAGKGMQAAVAAMVGGIFVRMLLVTVGLLVTIRALDAEPIGFVLSFFALFVVFVVLEWRVVNAGKSTESVS